MNPHLQHPNVLAFVNNDRLCGSLDLSRLRAHHAAELCPRRLLYPYINLSAVIFTTTFITRHGGLIPNSIVPVCRQDCLDLLTQRDLPNWGLSAKPQVMQRLLKMLAAVHGQLWNASQIGQSLGLSYHTVNGYVHFLEGAFLIRKLKPWSAHLRKQLVRSPKCYWRDTGILHSLLNVRDYKTLLNQRWVGVSWEGFVMEQILDTFNTTGRPVDTWFFRTSDGSEIDLLIRYGHKLWAIEVKLTSHPSLQDFDSLNHAADLVGADKRVLVSQTTQSAMGEDRISCSLPELLKIFAKPNSA